MHRITILVLLPLFFCIESNAQLTNYNLDKGFAVKGYDAVSYFKGEPKKGMSEFQYEYDGVRFKFSSNENLETFKNNPEQYIPQYGGYCAYALGVNKGKVDINPETFEIRDGKLYLFYNKFLTNTYDSWVEEGPEKLRKQADKNWEKIEE